MMTHEEKVNWMARWAADNGLQLQLKGEVGICRECVGVTAEGSYPEYEWFDDDYNRLDDNGDVFTPDDAYHKGPYVAVLGRGKGAEEQLFDWLKWFDENGFKLETGNSGVTLSNDPGIKLVQTMLGKHRYVRLKKGGD